MRLEHIVSPGEDGLTLQQLLRGPLGLSGRETRTIKQSGGVSVDGAPFFSNQPLRAGMTVRVQTADYAEGGDALSASALPAPDILWQDGALLCAFKPAGLQCHPSPSAPRGSDTLEARVSASLGAPAHPVHRLDAETTGLVLFAKLPFAQAHLQRQMADGQFFKTYRAWVFGRPQTERGEIDAPIARQSPDSFTRVVRMDGQHAVSRYRTLDVRQALGQTISLLSLEPVTGRTHQLRVHMAHIGCPLLGDARYATPESAALSDALGLTRHQLSAVSVSFLHPVTGERMTLRHAAVFDAPLDSMIAEASEE